MISRLALLLVSLLITVPASADHPRKKIVLIAGPKSHGPVGNGIHDYGWSVKLLKVMLDHSNVRDQVQVEYHLDGWPRDPRTLEDADAIMIISDGRDGDKYQEAPHLASEDRVREFDQLLSRGKGFLTFHFSTFTPDQYAEQILRWSGGYFDWETNGQREWYSAITTKEAEVKLGSPDHPISRGLKPFTMREEFYYNIRFSPKDESLKPIWVVPSLEGREPNGDIVAWARERADGGRGFGTTCGHFYDNWKEPQFRKMIQNAIVWSAGGEVPKDGVEAAFYTHEQIEEMLAQAEADKTIRVLMFAGNDAHKWHNWEKTTPAIKTVFEEDPNIQVDVSHDIEDLSRKNLSTYDVIVQNYVNWHDPTPLSDESKEAFLNFVKDGGGLILVHFANGAFHYSLPEAGDADWPEYRQLVRRVWNHEGRGDLPKSGHDAFGPYTVRITEVVHPITEGLDDFEVMDELYFHQHGEEPIEPLIVAHSKITKRDEPLAWVYQYGEGRVFQTLLGHSEKTYKSPEASAMLRRAVLWASQTMRP